MHVALATAANQIHTDQDDRPLLEALHAAGHQAELAVWDDPDQDWSRFDGVVVRSTWDYHHRWEAFVAWAARVEAVTRLVNPAEVVRWNTHKGYLLELEERGAPLVPTAWLAQGDRVDLMALATSRGWDEVVVKPAVGAGGDGIQRGRPADVQGSLDHLLAGADVLVQPFVPSVASSGELSVILFGGEVSHGIVKHPAPGEFLVQIDRGGRYEPIEVIPADAAALARWVVDSAGHELVYARVDLLQDEVGTWLLNELEVTEPGLFMHLVPGAAERLVAALERTLTEPDVVGGPAVPPAP